MKKETTLSVLKQIKINIDCIFELLQKQAIKPAEDTKEKYFKITDEAKLKTSEMLVEMKKSGIDFWTEWGNAIDVTFPIPKNQTTRYFSKHRETISVSNLNFGTLQKLNGMTLREYIIFFQKYFKEFGRYPDEKGWTVFSDALPSGFVADGGWRSGHRQVAFYWSSPCREYSLAGAREAIIPDNF